MNEGSIEVIDAEELKRKLDSDEPFKLVNALGEWEFRAKHIPGSIHFPTSAEAFASLQRSDDIVVYCSNPSCRASAFMCKELRKRGYEKVKHFEGGLMAWEDAGYPLVGEWVT